jgi:hypothetical protein
LAISLGLILLDKRGKKGHSFATKFLFVLQACRAKITKDLAMIRIKIATAETQRILKQRRVTVSGNIGTLGTSWSV